MSKRSNSRKLAMRMIYQFSVRKSSIDEIFSDLEKDQYADDTVAWALHLAKTTTLYLNDLDTIIEKYSIDWDVDRLNLIDKALLRLGIAEINYTDTPYQVVLNEIIELSKEYSTEESSKFINGILGKYVEIMNKDN